MAANLSFAVGALWVWVCCSIQAATWSGRTSINEATPAVLAPAEELADRQAVGPAGVAVAEVGGEELEEALPRILAGGSDDSRQCR